MADHESLEPTPDQTSAAADGLDPKVAGLLSYLIFMWIGGLIMFLTQKDPEVRFHGAQSILTAIALIAVSVGLAILGAVFSAIPFLGWLGALISLLVSMVLSLVGFVLWIFLCIKGYNLEHFKLPFIGDMAERWAAN